MEVHQLEILISKYNAGECTPEEKLWLEQWYLSFEWSSSKESNNAEMPALTAADWNNLQQRISEKAALKAVPGSLPAQRYRKALRYVAAASVAAASLFFIYKWQVQPAHVPAPSMAVVHIPKDIKPGTSKASLTMGDGSVIVLDSSALTQMKEEDGTTINKQFGKIIYKNETSNTSAVVYNTLNIPRGAEYELVLSDGTKVWLNAESFLQFPTRFTGKERVVRLTGEAYFEVAKNGAQPFKVIAPQNMEVEVTGTHFNVMAYSDEAFIKTTLTEGKVNIRNGKSRIPLLPLHQASLEKNTQQLNIKKVDIDKEIAWKKGMIEFNDDNLPFIMRQLARWYDVDVDFEGSIPEGSYNGSIPRKATLSQVMQILKLAGVKYRFLNRTVVITGA